MKRFLDILLVIVFAPFWLPLALIAALLVALFLGFPIFFFDLRAGKDGVPFRLVKFRSMRTGPGTDADRLTKFGRFLRASSLDELPEMWNILRGDMSLVGPRPLPVRYLTRYTPEQRHRHDVRPGLTGWAQVHGRNALDWVVKFRYDLEYVRTRSLALDAKILAMTVVQVLFPRHVNHAGEATMCEFKGE